MHARAIRFTTALALLLALLPPAAGAATWNYRIGEEAPAFALKGLDGKPLSTADLRGHYSVISFMTSWCPFCNAAAPHFDRIGKDYAARGVRTAIVDVHEKRAPIAGFARKYALSCPVLLDKDGSVTTRFAPPKDFIPDLDREVTMIASFMIVDPEGKIRFLSLNEKPEEFDAKLTKLRTRLDELLAGK
jgi:peroxiredoxin